LAQSSSLQITAVRYGTMNDHIVKRVKEIQASMVQSAGSSLDESNLPHLRCLIRLTVEFHHYLEHGSTELAMQLLNGPYAKYVPDAKTASQDPFNKYDREFACDSIRSGMESFCTLAASYRLLEGALGSKIEWGVISSRDSFNKHLTSMFEAFTQEDNFETKCRLLLDLFKLQIVFAGMSYAG
jgi:hypothetical protein